MSGYGMRFVVRLRMAAYAANGIAPGSDSCGKRVRNRMAEVGNSVNMTSEMGVSFHSDNYAKKQNIDGKKEVMKNFNQEKPVEEVFF